MRMRVFRLALFCLIAACVSGCASNSSQQPADSRTVPTVPAPAWVESAEVITLENVARIRYLGRLDSASMPSTIFAHALSPDGTRLAGLNSEQLIVWDLVKGNIVFNTGRAEAVQVFFAPDKTEVYTLTITGEGAIHNARSGLRQNSFQGINDHNGIAAFDPEHGWLALGSYTGDVRIWDPLERRAVATLAAHSLQITALAFSADGERLATAGEEGSVKIWNWRTRELLSAFSGQSAALSLRFSPDGRQLAAGQQRNTRLWPLAEDQPNLTLDTAAGGIEVLEFSPDGRFLLTGGPNTPDMSLWNAQDGSLAARLPGVGGDRVSAAFSPDGALLVTSVLTGSASLWNMTSIGGQAVQRSDLDTRGAAILTVDWSSDSRLITLFGALNAVYIWGIGPQSSG